VPGWTEVERFTEGRFRVLRLRAREPTTPLVTPSWDSGWYAQGGAIVLP
jgi:hypothetical protein